MDKNNLQKSIALIGPSGVGKSLIASELSKKTHLPVISLDDLKYYSLLERQNYVSPSNKNINMSTIKILCDLQKEKETKININDNQLLSERKNQIKQACQTYYQIIELFNSDLKFIDEYIDKYLDLLQEFLGKDIIHNFNAKISLTSIIKITSQEIETILSKINTPIILDLTGSYGWNIPEHFFGEIEQKLFEKAGKSLDTNQINKQVKDILENFGTVVLLEPANDYMLRTKFDKSTNSPENELILKNIKNFYDNANIVIPTGSIFYENNPKILSNRLWFNTKNDLEKEKLKNSPELANICHQILEFQSLLNQMQ